ARHDALADAHPQARHGRDHQPLPAGQHRDGAHRPAHDDPRPVGRGTLIRAANDCVLASRTLFGAGPHARSSRASAGARPHVPSGPVGVFFSSTGSLPPVRATRRLASFLLKYRLLVILAPIMMAIEVGMDLMQPRLTQRIIDQGIANNDLDEVLRTGGLMLLLSIVGMVAGVLCGIFAVRAAQGFGADLRAALFSKVQSLSFANLDRLETGGLVTRLTTDVTQLSDAMQMLLRIMVRAPLLLVGSLALGIATAPRLALLFIVLIPIIMIAVSVVFRRAFPLFKQVQERLDRINGIMQENLAGVRVVKAFARHDHETARFGTGNDNLRDMTMKAVYTIVAVMPVMMLTINFGLVGALWFGGRMVDAGDIEVGALVAFTNYMVQTLFALMMVSMVIVRFTRAEASAERVNEVLDSVPEIVSSPTPITEFRPTGEVRFENVTFRYKEDAEPVLDD